MYGHHPYYFSEIYQYPVNKLIGSYQIQHLNMYNNLVKIDLWDSPLIDQHNQRYNSITVFYLIRVQGALARSDLV